MLTYRYLIGAALLVSSSASYANDSSSAVGLGGLQLTRNDAVSMDSEDLYLSLEKVVVKYRFTNNSKKDVETLVSFPMPPLPGGVDAYLGDQGYPNWKDFAFQTLVNGKPVTYSRVVKIEANGKDVSARLQQLGWRADHWMGDESDDIYTKLQKLTPEQRDAYIKEGLIIVRKRDPQYIDPNWQITTFITRKQIFPAGKTINVEHSYAPITGGSVGGMMEKDSRNQSHFQEYKAHYCIDKSFLTGFDKRRYSGKKDAEGNEIGNFYTESWLDYILKSGANWKGPIKDFRLVIDKGEPDNLLSLCMDGVKKISPTRFEIRKRNFEPAKDINILIVNWYEGE
jgi:hypothetical protein